MNHSFFVGKVYILVIINKKGKLTKPKILQSLGYGCDKAALKSIDKLGILWKPAKDLKEKE